MPLAAGDKLGPYEILAPIGAGGMGVVYRALDTKLNRPVAIKFLSGDLADVEARHRFQREAQLASSLNHPHIVTVYDVGDAEGRQYIVTEFVDGGTLKDWARDKSGWRQIAALLTGVADGLAVAHGAGILHRDLKPANILVSKSGYAKLADFGLAKLADEPKPPSDDTLTMTEGQTRPGVILGTLAYMSPEQAAGRLTDARSDIFSFGIVLYELLAGQRPFSGATDLEVLQTIIHAPPKPLPEDIPLQLRLIVDKALEKDASERYQSMRELVVDLKRTQRLKEGETLERFAPAGRRAWRVTASIALVVLLIVAAAFWRLWQQDYFWRNPLDNARVERLTDFETDEMDAAVSPDGKFATFVSNRDGPYDAWVTQIGSDEFVNVSKGRFNLPIPPSPIRFVGFTGDGAQAWFEEQVSLRPNKLRTWLVSNMGGNPRPMLDSGMEPAWSPDGKQVVFHTADAGDPIYIADRTGADAKMIFVEKPGVHCHYLSWSPDGRFIYFVKGSPTTEEMDIWRLAVPAGGNVGTPERITNHNSLVMYTVWLDTRTLIYSAEDGSGQALYAIDVDRRIPHRVSAGVTEQYLSVSGNDARPPRLVATVANPSASLWAVPISDGVQTEQAVTRVATPNAIAQAPRLGPGYLLFLSSKGGGKGLWKLENDASRELWKGSDGGVMAAPAISPDGSKICFSYRKQGREGLYVMNSDGTNVRALVETFSVRGIASWSPDGKWIAAAGNQGDGTSIFKVPVDGGKPERLLNTLSYHPVWSPDGKMIVYAEPQQGGGSLPVKAITPDKKPVPMPDIQVTYLGSPYRFVPNHNILVYLQATTDIRKRNFYAVDLDTGMRRQLTDLKPGYLIENFDISRDGGRIVFDRTRPNSDIVLIDPRR